MTKQDINLCVKHLALRSLEISESQRFKYQLCCSLRNVKGIVMIPFFCFLCVISCHASPLFIFEKAESALLYIVVFQQ